MAYTDQSTNGIAARANPLGVFKLDETTGLVAALDYLGAADLTASGTPPASVAGKLGTARLFVAADSSYLQRPSTGNPFAVGSGVRYERCWIYPTGTGAGVISGRWNDTGPIHEDVWYVDTDNSLKSFVSANGNTFANVSTPGGAITRNAWNFVERRISSDGTSGIAVCVNRGTEYGTAFSGPVFTGTNPWRMGQTTDGASKFEGRIDQFEMFSARHSDTVRDYVYNGGAGRDVWAGTPPGGLTAGTLSAPTGATTTSITGIVWAAATGNTGTVTTQLQSRLTSGVTADYADVSGQTASPGALTGITPSTSPVSRTFRVRFTDDNGSVYSNEVTGTPLAYTTVTGTGGTTGDAFNLLIPAGMANGTAAPLAIFHHGLSGTQDQQLGDANGLAIVGRLVQSGCRVLLPLSGGTAGWNSAAALAAAVDDITTVVATYNTTGLFEMGASMGGGQATSLALQAAATAYASPGTAIRIAGKPLYGLITYAAAVNRTWLVANGFGTSITTAGSTYDPVAVVAGNGNALRGLPLAQLYNASDPSVDSTSNSITLKNDLTDGGSHTTFVDSVNSAHVGDGLFTTAALDFLGDFIAAHQTAIIALPIVPQVATPTFSPVAGAVASGTVVTFSSTTSGATFYSTIDGSTPTTASTAGATRTVTADQTIKLLAGKGGMTDSSVASAAYTVLSDSETLNVTLTRIAVRDRRDTFYLRGKERLTLEITGTIEGLATGDTYLLSDTTVSLSTSAVTSPFPPDFSTFTTALTAAMDGSNLEAVWFVGEGNPAGDVRLPLVPGKHKLWLQMVTRSETIVTPGPTITVIA